MSGILQQHFVTSLSLSRFLSLSAKCAPERLTWMFASFPQINGCVGFSGAVRSCCCYCPSTSLVPYGRSSSPLWRSVSLWLLKHYLSGLSLQAITKWELILALFSWGARRRGKKNSRDKVSTWLKRCWSHCSSKQVSFRMCVSVDLVTYL